MKTQTFAKRFQKKYDFYKKHFSGDLSGAIATTITSLPLALAFGVASGAGPIAGLYGTICVGFFAAVFGGCPPQISAPNSGMTALMTVIVAQYSHNLTLAFTVVMMAGLFQVLFGYLKVGRYLSLVPTPVTSGFITGIGIYIICIQFGRALGHKSASTTLESLMSLKGWLQNPNMDAVIITAVALSVTLLMPKSWTKRVPPSMVALGLCTFLSMTLLPHAPKVSAIPSVWPVLQVPTIEWPLFLDMVKTSLMVASMSSLYSLIGALMADNALGTHHNTNQELIGQGVGNMVSGLMGGLAGNGTAVRTMVNIRNGARTSMSGALSALFLLVIVLGFGSYAQHVPIPLLAGLLIKSGWDIMDWSYLRSVQHTWPFERALFILIVILTVCADLLWAMGVGVTIAALWTVMKMAELQKQHVFFREIQELSIPSSSLKVVDHETSGKIVSFQGSLGYGFNIELSSLLAQLQHSTVVILDWSQVTFMDTTIALAFGRFLSQRKSSGLISFVVSPHEDLASFMKKLGVFRSLDKHHQLSHVPEAQTELQDLLQGTVLS